MSCRNRLTRLGGCLLACALFAVVPAFGQLSVSPNFGTTVAVGASGLNGFVRIGNVDSEAFPITLDEVHLNPACKTTDFVIATLSPCDAGQGEISPQVLQITSQGLGTNTNPPGTSACVGDTFTISAPDGNGTVVITPLSNPTRQIPFGGYCDIAFTFNVNRAPSVDRRADPGLQAESDGIARGSLPDGSKTFGTGPRAVTVTFVCSVKVDKQISCDNGASYQDTGLVSANEGGTLGCIGAVGVAGIKVQYQFSNTGTVGVTSCTISESNTNLSLQIAAGGLAVSGTSSFFQGTKTGTALQCSDARSSNGQTEPDRADLNCTCDVGVAQGELEPPHAVAFDLARFECCGAQVDKQVSCNGGASYQDTGFGDGTTNGCTAVTPNSVQSQYFIRNNGSISASCTIGDTHTVLLPGGATQTVPANSTGSTIPGTPVACSAAFNSQEPDRADLNCTCSDTGIGSRIVTDSDTANINCTVCSAAIDKQVSCDSGAHWQDVGFTTNNGDGTNGCIGAVGASQIQVRYKARNTGNLDIVSCTIGDSNLVVTPAPVAVGAIPAGQESDFVGTSSVLECSAANAAGEPDTATLNCTCAVPGNGTVPAAPVTDSAEFQCCGVQVDKQVSCNGGPFQDVGFADGAVNGCSAIIGQPVAIQYVARNRGTIAASCSLTDLNAHNTLFNVGPGGVVIPANTTTNPIVNGNTLFNTCNPAWSVDEPNTASLNCSCSASLLGSGTASDADAATIACNPPQFSARKFCDPVSGTSSFTARVEVTNTTTPTANLSCTITDTFYSNASANVACGDLTGATANPVSLSPGNPVSVPGPTGTVTTAIGTIPAQPFSVCNQAVVECLSGGLPFPINRQTVSADCPVTPGGCTSRTPGYWGTHPDQTFRVLGFNGGSIVSCGIPLNNVFPMTAGSTTEDLCESNQDAVNNNVHNTSPQQLQLIRQCTAARINVVLSNQGGQNCEQESPGITALLNTCCTGLCNSGAGRSAISNSGCIESLDAFNNRFDNRAFPPGTLTDVPADSAFCGLSSGNRWVNPGRNLGPR